tara:strand:+ start:786 stop:950 length:165 start_codon:yes stop_codon:yes gene_type:complete
MNALEFIFSSFWIWLGFNVMILTVGHALAMPFFWYYKLKQFLTTKDQFWNKLGN